MFPAPLVGAMLWRRLPGPDLPGPPGLTRGELNGIPLTEAGLTYDGKVGEGLTGLDAAGGGCGTRRGLPPVGAPGEGYDEDPAGPVPGFQADHLEPDTGCTGELLVGSAPHHEDGGLLSGIAEEGRAAYGSGPP